MVKKKIVIPDTYKYISVFLTLRCNLHCSYCLNEFVDNFEREREELSGIQWAKSLNKIVSRSDVPITFTGGEPSLHKDFIYILNNLKSELNIDILTNMWWSKDKIKTFMEEINPDRIKRDAPYPSIRASYHPEQMQDGQKLVENVKELQDAGFSVGIESVMYPSDMQLTAIEQMAIRCRNLGVSFRPKSYTGKFEGIDDNGKNFSITYGNYSKYNHSAFNSTKILECMCKTTELLIGPNGDVYRCHRDLFSEQNSIGNITSPGFEIQDISRPCNLYGRCHPCDVKVKTNYKQELGHTSVKINNIKWNQKNIKN